ncbi:MAG TPA: hypothetical protein VFJ85_10525 [Acidimicrobiales bacterium]|nr:hypothetical protein [Acidimicrobiales bacterium]
MILALAPIVIGFVLAVLFAVFMLAEAGVRLVGFAGRLGKESLHRH